MSGEETGALAAAASGGKNISLRAVLMEAMVEMEVAF
jgi:hypothetical protein